MLIMKWGVVILCALQGGYMLLDGARALVIGSYITPGSGQHAGELGPWATVVAAVGVPPESTGMKAAFVVLGVLWLALGAGLAVQSPSAWAAGLVLAVATLWYLVPGTMISVLVLGVLLTPTMRGAFGRR